MSSSPVIIVTGASRGIGLATVQAALSFGCNVVGVGRTQILQIEAWKDLLEKYSSKAHYIVGDITSPIIVKSIVSETVSRYGRIDSVVLNAGILQPFSKIRDINNIEQAKKTFDVNFWSVWSLIQESLNEVVKTKGRFIIVSSGAASNAISAWGAYCCSKAAVNMLGFMVSTEEPDVTTISIRPGIVDTDMQKLIREQGHTTMPKELYERFVSLHSTGALVKVEDSGYQLAKMAIEAPKELNGQFLNYMDEKLKPFRHK